MRAMDVLRRWALERGGLLVAFAAVLYVWVACPYIVGNDNAEFSTLSATGGIAHPSGYPGYVLWLRAWSWLPASTPASAAALATIVLALLQLLVLHAACRAWGARPAAATLAVGLYAAAPIVLRYSTEAEAFAGNQLVVALVLWLAAERGPLQGNRRAFVLGLVAGLGMTNHLTCTLVAPIGILGVWRASREVDRRRVQPVLVAAAGWLVGMLPYAYCFVAPENLLAWHRPQDFGELLDIILRRQYGGAIGFSGAGDPVPYTSHLAELARSLARSLVWLGAALGLGALGLRIARPAKDGESRAGWIALALAFVVAGPILATQFDVPTADFGLHIVHRFHLLPVLLLVIPLAVGLSRLPDRGVAYVAAHAAFLVAGALASVDVARYRTPAMENMAKNTLRSMPPNAVIMAPIVDELDVGIRYLQLARGERNDVLFFRWPDLAVRWYRDRFAPYGVRGTRNVDIASAFLADGRPVFAYWWDAELRKHFPSYTFGVLVRLLPVGQAAPPIGDVFAQNRALYETFDFSYPLPGRSDEFATWVHRKYTGTWARLSQELEAAGRREDAAIAVEMARALSPQK
jgi:hypothetical protein